MNDHHHSPPHPWLPLTSPDLPSPPAPPSTWPPVRRTALGIYHWVRNAQRLILDWTKVSRPALLPHPVVLDAESMGKLSVLDIWKYMAVGWLGGWGCCGAMLWVYEMMWGMGSCLKLCNVILWVMRQCCGLWGDAVGYGLIRQWCNVILWVMRHCCGVWAHEVKCWVMMWECRVLPNYLMDEGQ